MVDAALEPPGPLAAAGLPAGVHACEPPPPGIDDPAGWSAFGRPLGGDDPRWESWVAVEGMHCATCALAVEDALCAVSGVSAAAVQSGGRRARVLWSPQATTPSRWFEAVRDAGYRLSPVGIDGRQAVRRRESRRVLFRWLVSGLCMMQVMMYAVPAYVAGTGEMTRDIELLLRWASWVLSLPVVLLACGPFFRGAWQDLRRLRVGMDTPVALGIAIAFAVSTAGTFDPDGALGREVYFDSLTMFVFFLLTGRWLESRLRERTAGALDALLERLPDSVERIRPDGSAERVGAHRLRVGDVLRVRPGEAFTADGCVVDGDTSADEALVTGEAHPVPRPCGSRVLAGSHNVGAQVLVRVDALGGDTRFGRIVALMESASVEKPRLARAADRVARPFLLAVMLAALAAAVWWWPSGPGHALMVAASVLIVTCPCALSLATPAAMLACAGERAGQGVLVADKTGTLTRPLPRLDRIYSRRGVPPGDALGLAAAMASGSVHPASRALVAAWTQHAGERSDWTLAELVEVAGRGVEGRLLPKRAAGGAGRRLRLGSAAHCGVPALEVPAMQVHLSDDEGWLASFVLDEELRPDARAAVSALRDGGIDVRLLSGDRSEAAHRLAAAAGIGNARGDCQPEDKLEAVRRLQSEGRHVAMVGDGLNDGPVIAQADVAFAVGQAVGRTRAKADFIVLGDALTAIPATWRQARRTMRVVRQNIAWSVLYNAACVPLALAGWMPAWLAGLGMAASSLLVVLNSARLARSPVAPAEASGS
ncbi:MAG: heavy metal translocating P-type ATPase [Variovorax paradoxus]|uniref:Heavy metal translocating P-type ATPase n=1 Tax=Variovorax paradoxus TaxID=34073 RepID=A0A2W5PP99_VARPD|nr:MAG: heavy metal translocating P-type ATPase [Variovorax paradoxus]